MQRRYSKLLGASTLLLSVLMLLSFTTSGSQPTLRKVIQIRLEMYDNQKDINAACQSKTNVNGCTYYNARGVSRIVIPTPDDFCDWSAMRTAGHELYHAAGLTHEKTYAVDHWAAKPAWTSRTCAMGTQ